MLPLNSHWNYRLVKIADPYQVTSDNCYYAIKEVYYTNNFPHTCTTDPVSIIGESKEEIRSILQKMLVSLDAPIIDDSYFDNWSQTLFSIYDAAKYLNVSNNFIKKLIKSKKLRATLVEGHYMILGQDLSNFKDESERISSIAFDEMVLMEQEINNKI